MSRHATTVVTSAALWGGIAALVASAGPTRTRFAVPADQPLTLASPQVLAISPNGPDIVYVANFRLYRRRVGERQSIAIAGTDSPRGVFNPVFSPDGGSVAFWSAEDQALKRVPLGGGAPTTICQTPGFIGLSWGSDDQIVFAAGQSIMRVSAGGGIPQPIVTMKNGELAAMPQMLPGEEAVLFTVLVPPGPGMNPWENGHIVVESLRSHDRRTVLAHGSDAQYLPSGRLVSGLGGRVLATPFDLARLEVTGTPVPIADDVRVAGRTQFAVSRTGETLVWVRGRQGHVQLAQVDLAGRRTPLGLLPDTVFALRVSPNGRQLTFDTYDGIVWVADLAHLAEQRPLTSGGNNRYPMWSADGQRILFTSERDGVESLVWQRADGAGAAEPLTTPARAAESWLPHSDAFSFITFKAGGDYDIQRYSVPDHTVTSLVALPGSAQHSSRFSPDGRWLAYASNETGRFEVFVQPVPATGTKWQITTDGGGHPTWSPDGQALYFDRSGQLFVVRVQPDFTTIRATPVPLPIMGFIQGEARRQYDSTPDGRRFLMMFPAASELETLRNW
jgi:Tol biopolymer transport system component